MVAPTYPLTMPSVPDIELVDMGLDNATLDKESGFTGAEQIGINPFAKWDIDFSLPKMERAEAAPWISFFAQLRGKGGRFTFPIPGTLIPLSGFTGTVGVVDGAAQTGYTLLTKNWTGSSTLLEVGDLFSVNGELKVVRIQATSSGPGASTLTFDPPLRSSPADNAVITINSPTVILASKIDLPKYKISHPILVKTSMKCKERF